MTTARWTAAGSWAGCVFDPAAGRVRTPVVTVEGGFDRAVPYWNARTGDGQRVVVRARVHLRGAAAGDWVRMATWSRAERGPRDAGTPPVRVDQDTMLIEGGADGIEVEATLEHDPGVPPPVLTRLGITTFSSERAVPGHARSDAERPPAFSGPYYSQRAEDPAIAMRICGPTSLAMALSACGIPKRPGEVAALARDPDGAIAFGNWAYLGATAAEHGLTADVVAMRDLDELARTLAPGRMAILSISFADGELPGSPTRGTQGHLVLARGFDEDGNIVVDDPAGHGEGDGRVRYPREPFVRAWKKGIAIVLEP